jgi:hypothetical protein
MSELPLISRAWQTDTFWRLRRARLLTEFVPVVAPVLQLMVRGWFVGRILGLVKAPTETDPIELAYRTPDLAWSTAAFPWPLLRHGDNPDLHARPSEWMAAIFEHLVVAMMTVGSDPSALVAYDELYKLGRTSESLVQQWILHPESIVSPAAPRASGETPQQRRASLLDTIERLIPAYPGIAALDPDPNGFYTQVPYGAELDHLIGAELLSVSEMVRRCETRESDARF